MKNDYVVYGHFSVDGDLLFYVGKGRRGRHKTTASRSKIWKEFTSKNSWYYKILHSNLTNSEAKNIESEIIKSTHGLINYKPSRIETNFDDILGLFEINYDSPTGLVWLNWNGAYNPKSKRAAGDCAGTLKYSKNGTPKSCEVQVKGKIYSVHRIVWIKITGDRLSGDEIIDHIDGNPHNNRIENLRKVDPQTNSRNRAKQSNCTSGFSGVYLFNNGYGTEYYCAKVTIDSKPFQKYFSISKYGKEEAFRLACQWRKEQIEQLNANGAGYTDRHGT